MEHLQDVRLVRDKVVEAEVEARKVRAECERVVAQVDKEEQAHKGKLDEWQIEKKRLQQAQENFKAESATQERELKLKLQAVQDSAKEVSKEEAEFEKK